MLPRRRRVSEFLREATGHAHRRLDNRVVGYADSAAVYDVDRVMRALEVARAHTVVWVTLRQTTSNYQQNNARITKATKRWGNLVVADWNAYSRGKPWFRSDGLHLTATGATGLSRLLRPLVLNAISGS